MDKDFITYNDIVKDTTKKNKQILRAISKDIEIPLSDDNWHVANLLQDYLYNASIAEEEDEFRPGVGLAAPQIGYNINMFAIDLYNPINDEEWVELVINPKIISTSSDFIYLQTGEGCLSVDYDMEDKVTPRYRFIRVQYYDENLNKITKKIYGYDAIVFQHEYDHLVGKMYYDNYITREEANQKNIKPLSLVQGEEI